jgi:hypothetical protein
MKKGKTGKITGFDSIKVTYGTVDSKNLKSIYLNVQTWVKPKFELDSWNSVVSTLSITIKHSVYESLDTKTFFEKTIVDLDLRSSGISKNKKSFMNLEINLYLNSEMDFKSNELKEKLKNIINKVHQDSIKRNNYFDFSTTKEQKEIMS